jgi:hypothetical protein
MSTYKVCYRSKETKRRRSKHIEAASSDAARQLVALEATEIFSIEFVPPPLASDAQRDYLRAFGERRWNDATLTKDEAHDLIDQFVAKDAPTNWSFRDSYPATEDQFEKYHYFGGKLNPEISKLTQGEMGRLIDRVRPREGQDAPNPVSPRQAMCLRFFFEPAVADRFMRMTKKDVKLLFDAFYEENTGARKVWDSWKKAHGIPEHTYLVDPSRVEQNTYAKLGEPLLSLNCLQTFKTQKQLDAEWEQRRQKQQEEARIRHEEAVKVSKSLPSVDLSKVPYKTWSAAARAFKSKYKNFGAELFIEAREEIDVMLEENSAEDEKDNYSLIITVFFHDYDGLAWEIGVEVGDENTLEYCDHDATIGRVPRSLPFPSDRYAFERKAYEDFIDLLLSPATSEPKAVKAPQSTASDNPFSILKSRPVGISASEPPPLPPVDFRILGEKQEAPAKKAWWKFWQDR